MNELYCPYCGARLTGRSLKCSSCGQSLPKETLLTYGRGAQAELDNMWKAQSAASASYKSAEPSADAYRVYEPYDSSGDEPRVVGSRRCPYCFAALTARSKNCPSCGRELPVEALTAEGFAGSSAFEDAVIAPPVEKERIIDYPTTIEELRLYCEQHGMPLIKMRFFIGQDYRQPRAFGIYRDGNTFIVYKNKGNGQRAIRYRGPDEAFAVNELYQKLLSECHLRGIYPDGQSEGALNQPTQAPAARTGGRKTALIAAIVILAVLALFFLYRHERSTHGYYNVDDALYYRDGSRWYVYYDYDWAPYYGDVYDWDDYYLGYGYESDYGGYDFEDSDYWEEYHSSDNSSDYDDWDSFDTDWDSDW